MKTLLLSFIMMLLPMVCGAQKALKPVKQALKDKNYKEAVTQIAKLRTDSTYRMNTKLCLYGIEANRALNDAQNMKVYLKQSYDTLAFFSTTYNIVKEAVLLDSIENENMKNGDGKPREQKIVSEMLRLYYPNLNAAARFFYKKRNYQETLRYLRYCIDLPHSQVGAHSKLSTTHDVSNAVLYLSSAYALKNYPEVHRYENVALCDTASRAAIMKMLAHTAEAEKDTVAYERMLRQGWKNGDYDESFFGPLADYYNQRGLYTRTLDIVAQHLRKHPQSVMAFTARSVAYYQLRDYDKCVESAKQLLVCDTLNAEAHYYIGASYVNMVDLVPMEGKINSTAYKKALQQRQSLYALAEPELETYRKQKPEETAQWAPLLYKVYLALNRGKKFAEIENLLK